MFFIIIVGLDGGKLNCHGGKFNYHGGISSCIPSLQTTINMVVHKVVGRPEAAHPVSPPFWMVLGGF